MKARFKGYWFLRYAVEKIGSYEDGYIGAFEGGKLESLMPEAEISLRHEREFLSVLQSGGNKEGMKFTAFKISKEEYLKYRKMHGTPH